MAVRERKNTGPSGLAEVRVLAKSVRITMVEDGEEYDLPLDGIDKGRKSGRYNVSISADKSRAYLRPVGGNYIMSFERLGNRKGASDNSPGVPDTAITESRVVQRKDGKGSFVTPREIIFKTVFRIESEGTYKDMLTGTNLPYSFAAPSLGGNAADFNDTRRNLNRLERFLRVVGGMNMATVEIPYSPEPPVTLMWLEKHMLKEGKKFLGTITENGYIDIESISEIPVDLLPKAKKGKK